MNLTFDQYLVIERRELPISTKFFFSEHPKFRVMLVHKKIKSLWGISD